MNYDHAAERHGNVVSLRVGSDAVAMVECRARCKESTSSSVRSCCRVIASSSNAESWDEATALSQCREDRFFRPF
jgi:hypothetical protein